MGNTQSPPKKPRVTFHPGVKIDRYEEETRRYNHIMKLNQQLNHNDMDQKDQLASLIISYLNRCHSNTNMTAEVTHYNRVKSVCIVGLEAFQGTITEQQVRALSLCLLEYVIVSI